MRRPRAVQAGQTHAATADVAEAKGLQQEALQAARLLDLGLSHGREVCDLASQQRVVGRQGAVFFQNLLKIATREERGRYELGFGLPGR